MSTRAPRLPAPPLLCQPSSLRLPRQWGWGGRPCSFPELPSGLWDRAAVESGSSAAVANPTATLINATDLHGARHHSLHLPRLRLRPRHQPSWDGFAPSWAIWGSPPPMPSVCGGAVDSGVSSTRERVRICDVGKRGGASGYGDGAGSIELGREGNGRPLTHVWRVENSSAGSSFSSPCVWMLPVAVHFRARLTNGMEATSTTRALDSAMGIDQRQGERERLGWCR